MEFSGKICLVTGASRGIGRAIAEKLAREGASVAIVYSGNARAAGEALEALRALGARANAYKCDVADHAATGFLAGKVIKEFGGVDILVNNAGIVRDSMLLSMSEENFDAVISANLKGVYNMTHHLYRHFMKKREGRIINIASVVGITGNAGQANYAASKAGIIGFTKSVAKELAGRGVTCNAVAPGFIESDMTNAIPEKARQNILACVPAKRMGMPEDVAEAVAFLASGAASYITGEVLRVDGGMCM